MNLKSVVRGENVAMEVKLCQEGEARALQKYDEALEALEVVLEMTVSDELRGILETQRDETRKIRDRLAAFRQRVEGS